MKKGRPLTRNRWWKCRRSKGFRYGQEIAIANDKGNLYAIANKLPPTAQPATFGELVGKGIMKEPITGTLFNMKTGTAPSNVPGSVSTQQLLRI